MKPTSVLWNCIVKVSCPLERICLISSLVYICKAAATTIRNDYSQFIGLTENCFKDTLYKHKDSFQYGSKKNATI